MTEQQPISPLVAELITANLKASHATTDALINGLESQVADLRAELATVREGVMELIYGDYMPTTAAIQRALYPSQSAINYVRAEVES